MERAFVTGASGFLGRNLIEQLLAENWSVTGFDLDISGIRSLKKQGIELVSGDICDLSACESAMPDNVDAVFHLAGNTSHWKKGDDLQTKVNVLGTKNVALAALKKSARRFIHTSSIAAYGFHDTIINESTISKADKSIINYFRSKWLAEVEIRELLFAGLDAVILNPANIIGPYDYSGWSRLFSMIYNDKLAGNLAGTASFCHVREVARAHIEAYKKGQCGHNYLLGGADVSWQNFIIEIGKLLDKKTPSRIIPPSILRLIGRASYCVSCVTGKEPDITPEKAALMSSMLQCSSRKAVEELGYMEISIKEMLSDCYEWMKRENLIVKQ